MRFWRRVGSSILALGLAVMAEPAFAEEAAPDDESVATEMVGVHAYGALPPGFDPAAARPSLLARYGLPPRPDRKQDPDAYAAWLVDVGPEIARAVPRLTATGTRNRRADRQSSGNWSGVVATAPVERYGPASFHSVHAAWSVPAVQPPYGTCAQDPNSDTSEIAIWPGIGGYGQPGLLQAGTAARTRCADGETVAQHWAWYEFYPYPSVTIDTLPAAPGHVISVYVWSTSARDGHAHIVNRTLARSASFSFRAPQGVRLVGDSAEWIVERPSVDGTVSDLANYTETVVYEATAVTGRGERVLGGSGDLPRGIERTRLTMHGGDAGDGPTLSVADVVGHKAIRFRNRGPSRRADD